MIQVHMCQTDSKSAYCNWQCPRCAKMLQAHDDSANFMPFNTLALHSLL